MRFSYSKILVLCLLFTFQSLLSENKIIYLISPPRSLSVAFMRMIEARGDFAIMHEPSQWAFNKSVHHEFARDWFTPDAAQTFEEVKERIFAQAEHSNVFVKEMSFAVDQFLLHDAEFLRNPQVQFVFLLRNPHHAIISFYNKRNEVENNNTSFAHLVGYQACYEIFHKIKPIAVHKPCMILSGNLYIHPEDTIRDFCNHVGIEYKPESLSWDNLGGNFDGQQAWHEIKHRETTQHWHGDAIKSTGFGKPHEYRVDAQGKPTFEEITNPLRKKICEEAYQENLKYYELLLQERNILMQNQSFKVIDLTHPINTTIPTWTDECGFYVTTTDYPTQDGRVRAMEYSLKASSGTHIDSPLHFIENGISVDKIPVQELVAPLCVIDVAHKAHQNYFVTLADVKEFEKNHREIQAGDLVFFNTGWCKHWHDTHAYRNPDAAGHMHFPGITAEVAHYLLTKNIIGIGIDTLSPDGSHAEFPVHLAILGAGKYIVENLTNLATLPALGTYGVVAPLHIQEGAETPARVLGVIKF